MNVNKDLLAMVEKTHLGHFTYLPKCLGFDICEINGLLIINCDLKTSMFNIVYGASKWPEFREVLCKIK